MTEKPPEGEDFASYSRADFEEMKKKHGVRIAVDAAIQTLASLQRGVADARPVELPDAQVSEKDWRTEREGLMQRIAEVEAFISEHKEEE